MIPVRLTLSGFLSYQEPVELDFTGFHVACISGRNGAGKSALLDAMTWALFGEARKSDDSLINETGGNNTAKVEFEFIYEDADYLVRRQKSKGKNTIAEFYIRGADGVSWKSLSGKKLIDTNKRICATLRMDYKTFINASFFLQGKADQFTGQNPTERKKILSNILNLEVWETYKAKAAEKRKLAEINAQYIKGLTDEAEAELQQEPQLLEALKSAEAGAAEAEKAYNAANEKWQMAKANEAMLKALKENAERKQQERSRQDRSIRDQQSALDVRKKELAGLRAGLANAETIEQNYADLLDVRKSLDLCAAAAAEFSALEHERINLESVIQKEESRLLYEHSQLSREKTEQDRLSADRQKLQTVRDRYAGKARDLAALCSGLPAVRQELEEITRRGAEKKQADENLKEKINNLKENMDTFLANRGGICPTCGREMDEEHCRVHAAELREQISGLQEKQLRTQEELASERRNFLEFKNRIQKLEEQEKELNAVRVELGRSEQNLRMTEDRLAAWEGKGARLAAVETMLQNADYCQEERSALSSRRERIQSLGYDRKEHDRLNALKNRLADAEQEHQKLIISRGKIEPLEREISDREKTLAEAEERLTAIQEELEQAEKTYSELNSRMPDLAQLENERVRLNQIRDRANKELGQAEQRVKHLEDARMTLQNRGAEYREKLLEIRRYKDLEKAFGKDGIPALLIEQAVPEIEEQANEILQQLSSGGMSLTFNTQGSYKSKKDEVKETLDILISDPYGVREYEMFSGGEAFRINFSIRLALSRILAQRAGSRLQTLVIDEGFGSQDDEGRARLAEAITAVRSDFEKILVITHLPELKEAFPARIEVEKDMEGSHVEVVL